MMPHSWLKTEDVFWHKATNWVSPYLWSQLPKNDMVPDEHSVNYKKIIKLLPHFRSIMPGNLGLTKAVQHRIEFAKTSEIPVHSLSNHSKCREKIKEARHRPIAHGTRHQTCASGMGMTNCYFCKQNQHFLHLLRLLPFWTPRLSGADTQPSTQWLYRLATWCNDNVDPGKK